MIKGVGVEGEYILYAISGKVEARGLWSDRVADFKGYFIQPAGTDAVRGYVVEQYKTSTDPKRYIKGFYDKANRRLMFMKLCNIPTLRPLAYVWHDVNKEGQWVSYNQREGFFPGGNSQGRATVLIEKIHDADKKQQLVQQVQDTFSKMALSATNLNRELMEEVDELKEFTDPNSLFYLKPI